MTPSSSTFANLRAKQPAACTMPAAEPATFQHLPTGDVGQTLTDDEREEAIRRAGALMERRYADFARTGFLADLGDAHRAMLAMQALIRGRSKGQVLALEIKRGLI